MIIFLKYLACANPSVVLQVLHHGMLISILKWNHLLQNRCFFQIPGGLDFLDIVRRHTADFAILFNISPSITCSHANQDELFAFRHIKFGITLCSVGVECFGIFHLLCATPWCYGRTLLLLCGEA